MKANATHSNKQHLLKLRRDYSINYLDQISHKNLKKTNKENGAFSRVLTFMQEIEQKSHHIPNQGEETIKRVKRLPPREQKNLGL